MTHDYIWPQTSTANEDDLFGVALTFMVLSIFAISIAVALDIWSQALALAIGVWLGKRSKNAKR